MYIYVYRYIFFSRFFFILGYYKILNIVPCAVSRSLPFIYFVNSSTGLFCINSSISFLLNLSLKCPPYEKNAFCIR